MNAFTGGCLTPDFITGPLHSFSDEFTIRLIALENSITDIVSPVIMPFSICCHLVALVIGEPYKEPAIVLFD